MRLLLLIAVMLGALACSAPCKVTSQCERGEHCDFTTGDCIKGCETDDDCPGNTTCDPELGKCEIPLVPRPDTGIPTSTTSTTADAGPRD